MHLKYVKDTDGNTVAIQIPYPDFIKLEPLLKLVETEEMEMPVLSESESRNAMQEFLALHDPNMENKLPDLKAYSRDDGAENY